MPASRQMSTSRVASATSLAPQDLKNSLPPPKVPVPRLNAGTLNPEPPSCLYSIDRSSMRPNGRNMNYIASGASFRVRFQLFEPEFAANRESRIVNQDLGKL